MNRTFSRKVAVRLELLLELWALLTLLPPETILLFLFFFYLEESLF